jgi:hypothetical protein
MQKVVGSSPIIRSRKPAGNGGFLLRESQAADRRGQTQAVGCCAGEKLACRSQVRLVNDDLHPISDRLDAVRRVCGALNALDSEHRADHVCLTLICHDGQTSSPDHEHSFANRNVKPSAGGDDIPVEATEGGRSQTTPHRRTHAAAGYVSAGSSLKNPHTDSYRNASRRQPRLTDRSVGQGPLREPVRPVAAAGLWLPYHGSVRHPSATTLCRRSNALSLPRWGGATFSVKGVTVEAAFASTGARQAVSSSPCCCRSFSRSSSIC